MSADLNASDMVFHHIFNEIAAGTYPPGSRLPSSNALCQQYNASYVTVRAALQRLIALGLVETNTGGGTFVKSGFSELSSGFALPLIEMPVDEIWEMLEYRQWMEAQAAELAARKAQPQEIEHLQEIYEKMRHYHVNGMTELYSKSDYALHTYIAEIARNPLLKQVLDILGHFFRQQIAISNIYLGRDLGYDEHQMIIRAIEKGDPSSARFHAWAHVETTMELWKDYWAKKQTTEKTDSNCP